jgi:hypothetical protein
MRKHSGSEQTPVEEIFRGADGERWFGDGPPLWTQGRKDRPAMTRRQARLQRHKLAKALRRHGKGNEAALRLAEKIAACRPGGRCLSGTCPECTRATQRLFVATSASLIARSSVSTVAISVVLWDARVADGRLEFEPDLFGRLSRRLRAALGKAGVRQAIGGFDISANEHADQRFAPHFRPHAWIIVPASQFANASKAFREFFPPSKTIRRPVFAKSFDGDLRGLAYAIKTDFVRRISLPRQPLPDGSVSRRNTRDRLLLGRQRVELALALDRVGLGARIFLQGLRMVKTPDGARILRSEATKRPTSERQETRVPSPRVDGRLTTTRAALRPGAPPSLPKEPTPAGARRSTSEPTRRPIGKGDDPRPNQSTERRTQTRSASPSKHAGNGVKKPVPKKGE